MNEGVFLVGVFTGIEQRPPNKNGVVYYRAAFAFGAETRVLDVSLEIYVELQSVPRFTEVRAQLMFREYEGRLSLQVKQVHVGKALPTAGAPAGKVA